MVKPSGRGACSRGRWRRGLFGGEEIGEGGVAVGFVVGAVALGLEVEEEALGEVVFVFDDHDEWGFGHAFSDDVASDGVAVGIASGKVRVMVVP